jgi:integrase/recombinase XerC
MVKKKKNKYQDSNFINQIEQYISYLRVERHYALNTISAYQRDLSNLFDFCLKNKISETSAIDSDILNLFVMELRHKAISSKSIRRYLSSIRGFLDYLVKEEILTENNAKKIKSPKISHSLPKTIDFDDLKRLLSVQSKSYQELKSIAMIEIMYSCGLRVSELVKLNISDMDLSEGFVRVKGKGGKMRFSPIGSDAIKAIRLYLAKRPNAETRALFVNNNENRISSRTVQNTVKIRALEVGISVNIHPHMLRHAAATHFLQSSHDLRSVQEFLGHKSIKSTQVYTHLDFLELSKVYDKFHPRAKK